jgi:hypothetical protein
LLLGKLLLPSLATTFLATTLIILLAMVALLARITLLFLLFVGVGLFGFLLNDNDLIVRLPIRLVQIHFPIMKVRGHTSSMSLIVTFFEMIFFGVTVCWRALTTRGPPAM